MAGGPRESWLGSSGGWGESPVQGAAATPPGMGGLLSGAGHHVDAR